MNNISLTVSLSGRVTPSHTVIGHEGEHRASSLKLKLNGDFSAVEYFRIDFGGFYSKKLYPENNEIIYPIVQQALSKGDGFLQLHGFAAEGENVTLIFKSDLVAYEVLESIETLSDIPEGAAANFESAVGELEELIERASEFSSLAENAEAVKVELEELVERWNEELLTVSESGVWTPSATLSSNCTLTVTSAKYHRMGNQVNIFLSGKFEWDYTSLNGNASDQEISISGLPFKPQAAAMCQTTSKEEIYSGYSPLQIKVNDIAVSVNLNSKFDMRIASGSDFLKSYLSEYHFKTRATKGNEWVTLSFSYFI